MSRSYRSSARLSDDASMSATAVPADAPLLPPSAPAAVEAKDEEHPQTTAVVKEPPRDEDARHGPSYDGARLDAFTDECSKAVFVSFCAVVALIAVFATGLHKPVANFIWSVEHYVPDQKDLRLRYIEFARNVANTTGSGVSLVPTADLHDRCAMVLFRSTEGTMPCGIMLQNDTVFCLVDESEDSIFVVLEPASERLMGKPVEVTESNTQCADGRPVTRARSPMVYLYYTHASTIRLTMRMAYCYQQLRDMHLNRAQATCEASLQT